jgi:hypothetical protein
VAHSQEEDLSRGGCPICGDWFDPHLVLLYLVRSVMDNSVAQLEPSSYLVVVFLWWDTTRCLIQEILFVEELWCLKPRVSQLVGVIRVLHKNGGTSVMVLGTWSVFAVNQFPVLQSSTTPPFRSTFEIIEMQQWEMEKLTQADKRSRRSQNPPIAVGAELVRACRRALVGILAY